LISSFEAHTKDRIRPHCREMWHSHMDIQGHLYMFHSLLFLSNHTTRHTQESCRIQICTDTLNTESLHWFRSDNAGVETQDREDLVNWRMGLSQKRMCLLIEFPAIMSIGQDP
jgi:hypothetical protein